jgi:hypothetical protein
MGAAFWRKLNGHRGNRTDFSGLAYAPNPSAAHFPTILQLPSSPLLPQRVDHPLPYNAELEFGDAI